MKVSVCVLVSVCDIEIVVVVVFVITALVLALLVELADTFSVSFGAVLRIGSNVVNLDFVEGHFLKQLVLGSIVHWSFLILLRVLVGGKLVTLLFVRAHTLTTCLGWSSIVGQLADRLARPD